MAGGQWYEPALSCEHSLMAWKNEVQRRLVAKVFAEPHLGMKAGCDDVCISGDDHQTGNHLERTLGSQVDAMRPSSLYLPPRHPRACSVVQ